MLKNTSKPTKQLYEQAQICADGCTYRNNLAKCFQLSNLAEWLEHWLRLRRNATSGGQGSNPLSGEAPLSAQCM